MWWLIKRLKALHGFVKAHLHDLRGDGVTEGHGLTAARVWGANQHHSIQGWVVAVASLVKLHPQHAARGKSKGSFLTSLILL